MRVARGILRLKLEARLSHRQIGRACGASCSTVSEAVGRFRAADLSWPLPAELPDSALEARLQRGLVEPLGLFACERARRGPRERVADRASRAGKAPRDLPLRESHFLQPEHVPDLAH